MNRTFIILLSLALFLGVGFGGSFIGGVIYGQTLEDDASELSPRLGAASQFPGGGAGAAASQRGQGGAGAAASQRSQDGADAVSGQRGQDGGFAGARGGGDPAAQQTGGEGNSPQGASSANQRAGRPAGQRGNVPGQDQQSEAPAEPTGPESQTTVEGTDSQEMQGEDNTARAGGGPETTARGGLVGTVSSLEGDTLTVTSARGEAAAMLSDSTAVYEITESSRDSLTSETTVRIIGSRNQEGDLAAQSVIIMPAGTEGFFVAAGGPSGRPRRGGS